MARTPSRPRTLIPDGSADEAEAAFYEALQDGQIERVMACWADEDEILCIHPGGPRLVGALAIRSAYEAMFVQGALRIVPERVRRLESMGAVIHNVLERIEVPTDEGVQYAWVVATNVYFKTAQGWRLVMHHASPGGREVAEVTVPAPLLH